MSKAKAIEVLKDMQRIKRDDEYVCEECKLRDENMENLIRLILYELEVVE